MQYKSVLWIGTKSFNFPGLRHLLSNLSPVCEIPTEQSIIQDIVPKMYDQLKNAMYNDITAINMSDSTMTLSMEHWLQDDREYISYYINYILVRKQPLEWTFLVSTEKIRDERQGYFSSQIWRNWDEKFQSRLEFFRDKTKKAMSRLFSSS